MCIYNENKIRTFCLCLTSHNKRACAIRLNCASPLVNYKSQYHTSVFGTDHKITKLCRAFNRKTKIHMNSMIECCDYGLENNHIATHIILKTKENLSFTQKKPNKSLRTRPLKSKLLSSVLQNLFSHLQIR
jgi:hemerythrin